MVGHSKVLHHTCRTVYANYVGHTNCIFSRIAGAISTPVLMSFFITNSSFPQDPMKSVVDAKGWLGDGRGLLFVVGYKQ